MSPKPARGQYTQAALTPAERLFKTINDVHHCSVEEHGHGHPVAPFGAGWINGHEIPEHIFPYAAVSTAEAPRRQVPQVGDNSRMTRVLSFA